MLGRRRVSAVVGVEDVVDDRVGATLEATLDFVESSSHVTSNRAGIQHEADVENEEHDDKESGDEPWRHDSFPRGVRPS